LGLARIQQDVALGCDAERTLGREVCSPGFDVLAGGDVRLLPAATVLPTSLVWPERVWLLASPALKLLLWLLILDRLWRY